MRSPNGHIRRLLLPVMLLVALAAAASAIALATGPDLQPPAGLLFRPPFIDRAGHVVLSTLQPPPGLDTSRRVFLDRYGNLLDTLLEPPPGLDVRPVFIDRDGNLNHTSLDPPPGLMYPPVFIRRNGQVDPTVANTLPPPPGLDTRPLFIDRYGQLISGSTAAPPAAATDLKVRLAGIYPNPFNPAVEISFSLPSTGRVQVDVLDLHGRVVRQLHDGVLGPDLHVLRWNGCDAAGRTVAAGVYLFRVRAGGDEVVGRGVLVK